MQGDFAGARATIVKDLFRGPTLRVSGTSFRLRKDLAGLKLLSKDESRSAGRMLVIILLGITIIGLIIAIPMLIAHRKILAHVAIATKDGRRFIVQANRREWAILSSFQTFEMPNFTFP